MKEDLMQRKRKYLLMPKKELTERCLLIEEEIERLNNIINELEKWVKQEIDNFESITYLYDHLYDRDIQTYKRVLDKLKKLKGSDKE